MRCYKIIAIDGETAVATRYAGTNALARETRDQLMSTFLLKKKQIEIESADIPLKKEDLLVFVNDLLVAQDNQTEE